MSKKKIKQPKLADRQVTFAKNLSAVMGPQAYRKLKGILDRNVADLEIHFEQEDAWRIQLYGLKCDILNAFVPGLSDYIFYRLMDIKGSVLDTKALMERSSDWGLIKEPKKRKAKKK